MKRRVYLSIIFLAQLIISCKPESREILASADLLDVKYGSNRYNTMDVYLPANRNGNTRTIILIHGGYWYTGDKEDLTEYAEYLRDEGFACVTMNYRLTHTSENYINPAQINDVAKAIDFISARSSYYHISSSKFGLGGVSAGAHLAMLYTYAANTNNKVKSVASIAGPSDFTQAQTISPLIAQVLTWLTGSAPGSDPGAYIEISPIRHLTSQSKPIFIIHGKLDNIVPYQQSVNLKARLDELNVKNELRLYDNESHDFTNPVVVEEILENLTEWFEETIK